MHRWTSSPPALGDASVLALDDAADMSPFGVTRVASIDAGIVLLAIRALRAAVSIPVTSLLLIGDDSVIPFWRISNPVTDRQIDPDPVVLTDNPYGTAADTPDQYLAPPFPVGRLPDYNGASVDNYCDLIDLVARNRTARIRHTGTAAVVNADWFDISRSAASTVPSPIDWHLAPGYLLNRATQSDASREFLYFNLHGFPQEAEWKGFDEIRGRQFFTTVGFPMHSISVVLCPVRLHSRRTATAPSSWVRPSRIHAPSGSVWSGAALIGATGLAFGSHLAPGVLLQDADFLARAFFAESAGGHLQLGAALQRARADYLANGETPSTDVYKQKTLLQFILLGDPG